MAHDGHHRRRRLQLFGGLRPLRLRLRRIFVFLDGLEPEGGCDQLDLIEVETWFTVTISPSSLKANWTIWVAGTFMAASQLGDGDEFVDPNERLSRSFSSARRPA